MSEKDLCVTLDIQEKNNPNMVRTKVIYRTRIFGIVSAKRANACLFKFSNYLIF